MFVCGDLFIIVITRGRLEQDGKGTPEAMDFMGFCMALTLPQAEDMLKEVDFVPYCSHTYLALLSNVKVLYMLSVFCPKH